LNAKSQRRQAAKGNPLISTWLINFCIGAFVILLFIAIVFNKPFGNFAGNAGWMMLAWFGFVTLLLCVAAWYRKSKHKT